LISLFIPDFFTLVLSVLAQLSAAIVALRRIQLAGNFRLAWISISLALFLMVERRALPLWESWQTGRTDSLNAIFGLLISIFMLLGVVGLKRLFMRLHEQEVELHQLAEIDYLTKLHNRRFFTECANHELIRARRYQSPFSLLMIDIDFFKKINDSYGHQAGDAVLQIIAHICQKTVRNVDIVGRLGGEEFAIFLPEAGRAQALDAAERLRLQIAEIEIEQKSGKAIRVTVSIGVVAVENTEASLAELLERADQALYAAKSTGRNRVCCSD
jgi:diguanylate cyclase (GGDEF)-like protein